MFQLVNVLPERWCPKLDKYTIWGLSRTEYSIIIVSYDFQSLLQLMHVKVAFVFLAAVSQCWLMFNIWWTRMPQFLSYVLPPCYTPPFLHLCITFSYPNAEICMYPSLWLWSFSQLWVHLIVVLILVTLYQYEGEYHETFYWRLLRPRYTMFVGFLWITKLVIPSKQKITLTWFICDKPLQLIVSCLSKCSQTHRFVWWPCPR